MGLGICVFRHTWLSLTWLNITWLKFYHGAILLRMQERKTPRAGRPRGAKTFESGPALAFGLAIRTTRLEVQLSQEALAHAAQVERSHLGKIERGEHMPNLVLIFRLAKALNVAPGALVDRAAALLQDSLE